MNNERGQSSVEFIVAAMFVFIPLIWGINYLAKVADARHKTIEASRYALWEKTVWNTSRKNNTQINNEISRRIFGDAERPLDARRDRNQFGRERGDSELDSNMFLTEPGRGRAVREAMIVDQDQQASSSLVATNRNPNLGLGGLVTRVASGLLGLQRDGLHNTTVTREIYKTERLNNAWAEIYPDQNNQRFLTSINNAMLIGAWNADDPNDVRRTVRRAVPTSIFDNSVFRGLQRGVALLFDDLAYLQPGHVVPDMIPCQRGVGGNRNRQCQ